MRDPSGNLDDKNRLKDFEYRIMVSGSRAFSDAKTFDEYLRHYLTDLEIGRDGDKSRICFLTVECRAGVEKLLEDWCAKHGYHYFKFAPNWGDIEVEGAVVREKNGRQYNAVALVWANEEMAEVGSHLITFYDGVSSDTQDLRNRASEKFIPARVVLVHMEDEKKESDYGSKSQGR